MLFWGYKREGAKPEARGGDKPPCTNNQLKKEE